MFNNLLVLPKSGITARRRRRLVPIYGKEFTKPFGYKFAPFYHNWTYSFSPESILKMIEKQGLGGVKDLFQGVLMDESMMKTFKLPFTPKKDPFAGILGEGQEITTEAVMANIVANLGAPGQDQEFVENILPRLDAGMKQMSILGSIQFLVILLILGANLGFNTKFLYYIVANILTTEATSYAYQKGLDVEVSGNSIFGYTNYTMCFLLWYKGGFWKSSWALNLATLMAGCDFITQFFVPAASKILHGWGILIGTVWYYYGYKLK